MITQTLAIIVAITAAYLLLRLRHFILVHSKDKRRYYRAYVTGFDETDWDSGPDDNSNNESDSTDATMAHVAAENSLAEWPTELEIHAVPPARVRAIQRETDDCDGVKSVERF